MRPKNPREPNHQRRTFGLVLSALHTIGFPVLGDGPDKGKDEGKLASEHPWLGKFVVLKSLKTDLRVDRKVVPMPAGRVFHTFKVKKVEKADKGNWLWVVDMSLKGWVKEDEVVLDSKAHAYFTGLIEHDPSSAEAYYLRGSLGNGDRALADLTEAIRLDPAFAVAYVARAGVCSEAKDSARAILDLTEAIRINPRLAIAYRERASLYDEKKDSATVLADLTEVIRLNPGDEMAYFYRGVVYRNKDEWDRAVPDLTEAIRLMPRDDDSALYSSYLLERLYLIRGIAHQKQTQYDLAIADFTDAMRITKTSSFSDEGLIFFCLYSRADCWHSKKDFKSAIAGFTDAIERSPKSEFTAAAYSSRALVRKHAMDLDGALADYTEVLRLKSSPLLSALSYVNRGAIASDRNDLESALDDYAKATQLLPSDSFVYRCRANALNNHGRYARALADCDRAVEIEPKNPRNHDLGAWIRATCPDVNFRDGTKAVEGATRACELTDWKDFSPLESLAAAEAESGHFDTAVKWQSKALELVTDEKDKAQSGERLELFRKKRPYRDVRPATGNRQVTHSMPEIPLTLSPEGSAGVLANSIPFGSR